MADFITKQENTRRLMVVILCVVIDVAALLVGLLAVKKTHEIEKKEGLPDTIVKLKKEVVEKRAKNVRDESEWIEFATKIGWQSRAAGTIDRFETGELDEIQLKRYLNDWVAELKKLGVTRYKRWTIEGEPAVSETGDNLTLTALLDDLAAKEKEYTDKITGLDGDIKKERDAEKAIMAETEKLSKDLTKEIDNNEAPDKPAGGLIGDLIKHMKDFNGVQKKNAEELATLEVETLAKQTEATTFKNENVRKRSGMEGVKAELRRRIYTIEHGREEARERRDPDGVVIQVSPERQLCHINLLHADRLFAGTRFNVFALTKGGVKVDKGQVEVIEVRHHVSSICRIVRTLDPDWQIEQGDRIFNEVFEAGKSRYIAFAGHFSGKLSNQEAIQAIGRFGDHYQPKVDERTNYLVVAEGYEEHPNYKAAQDMGVKILLEKYLYDYLGVK